MTAFVVRDLPLAAGSWTPEHVHPAHHQINWTMRGVLGVAAGERSWVLPPTLALWLPAGVRHRTGATRDAVLRSLYVPGSLPDLGAGDPVPVAADAMLVALADHLARDDVADAARARAEGVLLDALRPLPTAPVTLPSPRDARAREVAAMLLADPADARDLDRLAAAAGTSRRTVSRLFVRETGLSFDRWRTRMRLRTALPMLAEGRPVAAVARAVGYATASAFLAAFRREIGTSPSRYLRPPLMSRGAPRVVSSSCETSP